MISAAERSAEPAAGRWLTGASTRAYTIPPPAETESL